AGFFLASHLESVAATFHLPTLWGFYLTLGICVGAGNGFGYVVPTAVGSKWFPDKRGLIVGLMVGGYGAGSAIFGPLATSLLASGSGRSVFKILAAIFFAMTMLASYLLRNPPVGYQPAGWSPARATAAKPGIDVVASEMVRTRTFWALWVAYALG